MYSPIFRILLAAIITNISSRLLPMRSSPIRKNKPNIHRFHETTIKSPAFRFSSTTPFAFSNPSNFLNKSPDDPPQGSIFNPPQQFQSVFNFDKIDSNVGKKQSNMNQQPKDDTENNVAVDRNKQYHKETGRIKIDHNFEQYCNHTLCEQVNFNFPPLLQSRPNLEQKTISKMVTNLIDCLVIQSQEREQAMFQGEYEIEKIPQTHQKIKYLLQPVQKTQKKKTVPYRTEYTINYQAKVTCVESGRNYSTNCGKFEAGYIDPYSIPTLERFLQYLKSQVCGIVAVNLESVVVYQSRGMIEIEIVCFVRPLGLAHELQFTFSSFSEGVVKDFRISNQDVQLKWNQDIEIDVYDLRDEIVINKYNIWLSDRFARNVNITFRHMVLGNQSKQEFIQFLKKQCPRLDLKRVRSIKYDSILNIGLIYL